MPQELFDFLNEGMGDPRDPQVQAETEYEWVELGSPSTIKAPMRQLEAV